MKFAFIIMGPFDMRYDKAEIHGGTAQIIGAADLKEACVAAKKLYKEGITCIELCGAFGEKGAKEIMDVTENKIPVGYVTHLPEQDSIYEEFFSGK